MRRLAIALLLVPAATGAQAETAPWLAPLVEAATAAGPHSPVGMFLAADVVVQSVMLALIAASVLSWALWLGKLGQIALARAALGRGYRRLAAAGRLDAPAALGGALRAMAEAARDEAQASCGLPAAGVKDRAAATVARIEAAAARRAQGGAAIIGTIGSSAPFIGLFGTVWGIMNSFIGIAETQTTNLSVVAPGIAEALLATGLGLVAAIPAVLFYNHLARTVAGYRAMLADAATLVQVTLSRDLDRAAADTAPRFALVAE